MAAGISTPSLRDIARQGVNIAEAAHSEITMPLIFLVPLNLLCAAKFFFNVFDLNKTWVLIPLLEAATVLMRVHLLLKISWSAPDAAGLFVKGVDFQLMHAHRQGQRYLLSCKEIERERDREEEEEKEEGKREREREREREPARDQKGHVFTCAHMPPAMTCGLPKAGHME